MDNDFHNDQFIKIVVRIAVKYEGLEDCVKHIFVSFLYMKIFTYVTFNGIFQSQVGCFGVVSQTKSDLTLAACTHIASEMSYFMTVGSCVTFRYGSSSM